MKYRDNMTAEEKLALLEDQRQLEQIYAEQPDHSNIPDEESLDYFNLYIAGD